MLYSLLLVAATALTGVSAQSLNYSTSGPFAINVTQVPYSLRQSWCIGEKNSCPPICGGSTTANDCDPTTLNYTCTCTSGAMPNLTSFENTIPNYVCIQWRINCIANHPNDAVGQAACQSVVCGTKNASSNEPGLSGGASSSAMSSIATSSATSSGSGSATSASSASATSASATHSGLAAAVKIGGEYGTGVLAVGMLAAFGLGL